MGKLLVTEVRKLRGLTATQKAVAFVLAERAKDDYPYCWPGYDLIAEDAGVGTRRHTIRIVASLVDLGVIAIEKRGAQHSSNLYRVLPGVTFETSEVTSETSRGDLGVTRTIRTSHIEPEVETYPDREGVHKHAAAARAVLRSGVTLPAPASSRERPRRLSDGRYPTVRAVGPDQALPGL